MPTLQPSAVPNELWGEILEHLPANELPRITFACKSFRELASPRIFRTFTFHPYYLALGSLASSTSLPHPKYMPSDEKVANALERLEFYLSPKIAPLVQTCSIMPWDIYRVEESEIGTTDPDFLLDMFFERVTLLQRLRNLECHAITFNARAISQLSFLHDLDNVDVAYCNLPTDASLLPHAAAHTRTFRFGYTARPEVLHESGANKWLRLLNPERLERLEVAPARAAAEFFGQVAVLQPFPAMRVLSVALPLTTIPHLPTILARVPVLARLKVVLLGAQDLEACHIAALRLPRPQGHPHLTHYDGPYEILPQVVGQDLRSLSIDSFKSGGEYPNAVATVLSSSAPGLQNLTFFGVRLARVDVPFFALVCSLSSNLKTIYIESTVFDTEAIFTQPNFLDEIQLDLLPPFIENLVLHWAAASYEESESKTRQFINRVRELRPSLQGIWVSDLRHLAISWRREESGLGELKPRRVESEMDVFVLAMDQRKMFPGVSL